jgi:hypothetical protein
MDLFFFHLNRLGQTIFDREGTRLPGLDEACQEAIRSARELMIQDLKTDKPLSLDDRVDIADEHGLLLLTVTFKQALGLPVSA